jgi:hypothetical protein
MLYILFLRHQLIALEMAECANCHLLLHPVPIGSFIALQHILWLLRVDNDIFEVTEA